MHQHALYPLFLQLEGEPVVVVGAGAVARRKVDSLLEAGARVRVVAPEATERIVQLADVGRVAWERRPYREGDAADALLVIGATGDGSVDRRVYAEARRNHALVNVVDVPDLCSAYVPSVLRRGKLQIAVCTSGAAPSLARDLRRNLESQFSPAWEDYVDLLAEVRLLIKQRVAGAAARRAAVYEAVVAMGLLERIEAGETLDAESVYSQVMSEMGCTELVVSQDGDA